MDPLSALAAFVLLAMVDGAPAHQPFCLNNPLHPECHVRAAEGEDRDAPARPSAPYSPGDFPHDPWGDNLAGDNPDFYCGACEAQS